MFKMLFFKKNHKNRRRIWSSAPNPRLPSGDWGIHH